MSTSTWSRLRWPFKALLIALPVITFGYFAINDGWFSATDDAVIDNTITAGAKNNEGGEKGSEKQKENASSVALNHPSLMAKYPKVITGKAISNALKGHLKRLQVDVDMYVYFTFY